MAGVSEFLEKLSQRHLESNPEGSELSVRIYSYQLFYRMQTSAMEAIDMDKATAPRANSTKCT